MEPPGRVAYAPMQETTSTRPTSTAENCSPEPADSQAWCLLAAAHLGAGRYQEAVAAASRAITLGPSDDWPYRPASTAQRHPGQHQRCRRRGDRGVQAGAARVTSYVCMAQAQLATEVEFMAQARHGTPKVWAPLEFPGKEEVRGSNPRAPPSLTRRFGSCGPK